MYEYYSKNIYTYYVNIKYINYNSWYNHDVSNLYYLFIYLILNTAHDKLFAIDQLNLVCSHLYDKILHILYTKIIYNTMI